MAKPDLYLGHVWVTVDDRALLETPETLRGFEEVTAFGAEGRRIVCHASSDSIGGLLHTAEDFLSCVSLSERMTKKG